MKMNFFNEHVKLQKSLKITGAYYLGDEKFILTGEDNEYFYYMENGEIKNEIRVGDRFCQDPELDSIVRKIGDINDKKVKSKEDRMKKQRLVKKVKSLLGDIGVSRIYTDTHLIYSVLYNSIPTFIIKKRTDGESKGEKIRKIKRI